MQSTNSRDVLDNSQSCHEDKHLPRHTQQINHSFPAVSRENALHVHASLLKGIVKFFLTRKNLLLDMETICSLA